MNEIINKYMRKHLRIEGKVIYVPNRTITDFGDRIRGIFNLRDSYNLHDWLRDNVGHTYITVYTSGREFESRHVHGVRDYIEIKQNGRGY